VPPPKGEYVINIFDLFVSVSYKTENAYAGPKIELGRAYVRQP